MPNASKVSCSDVIAITVTASCSDDGDSWRNYYIAVNYHVWAHLKQHAVPITKFFLTYKVGTYINSRLNHFSFFRLPR